MLLKANIKNQWELIGDYGFAEWKKKNCSLTTIMYMISMVIWNCRIN